MAYLWAEFPLSGSMLNARTCRSIAVSSSGAPRPASFCLSSSSSSAPQVLRLCSPCSAPLTRASTAAWTADLIVDALFLHAIIRDGAFYVVPLHAAVVRLRRADEVLTQIAIACSLATNVFTTLLIGRCTLCCAGGR